MLASAEVHLFPNGVPNYFSGTNCRVFADAVATGAPTQGFTHVWVYINSELVAEFQTDLGVVAMQHASAAAMFDSTHFAPGTTVSVTALALDEDDVLWQSPTYTIPVKNKMHLFGRYDLEVDPLTYLSYEEGHIPAGYYVSPPAGAQNPWAAAIPVHQIYSQHPTSHYSFLGPVTWLGWTMDSYLSSIETTGCNVCFVSSHGGVDKDGGGNVTNAYFESDRSDWWFDHPAVPPTNNPQLEQRIFGVYGTTTSNLGPILPSRQAAHGVGLPPFNTGLPPINLVFVNACHSGEQGQTFSEGYLFPYGNAYTGQSEIPENQAFVGWDGAIELENYRTAASEFFESMALGYNANRSRIFANGAIDSKATMVVYGDFHTRVSGVYDPGNQTMSSACKRGL